MKSKTIFWAIGMGAFLVLGLASPGHTDDLEQNTAEAIALFKKTDSELGRLFGSAYGYAVYPKVGKGGFGVGGAHGKGLVFRGGRAAGRTSMLFINLHRVVLY